MEQNVNKIQKEGQENTKKLTFVVLLLSIFVIALFGLVPLAQLLTGTTVGAFDDG